MFIPNIQGRIQVFVGGGGGIFVRGGGYKNLHKNASKFRLYSFLLSGDLETSPLDTALQIY